jgi:fatty acid desaturase
VRIARRAGDAVAFRQRSRFAWAEYITTAIVFTTFAAVRFFRNDEGQKIGERGLEGSSAGARTLVSIFATIAVFAMSIWALLLIQIPAGLHSSPYLAGYPRPPNQRSMQYSRKQELDPANRIRAVPG